MSKLLGSLAAGLFAAAALAGPGLADVKVTDHAYTTYAGGGDATTAACSVNNRQQNEPTAAVNPSDPSRLTAGANDYCTVPTNGDAWAGFYYSSDGGATWANSLVPGYPADTSPAGLASPLHGLVRGAGDPVQAWDNAGRLYYAGIAFNRTAPTNGSIWMARYSWPAFATSPIYDFTTLVSQGTPSPIFLGHFEDKVMIEVDKGAASPFAGNVYICWARFTGGANNFVYLARSSDGGRSFRIQKLSESIHGSQSCDIAVTRNGTVFVAWRQFDFPPPVDTPGKQKDAVVFVKSTDGGRSFTKPRVATEFVAWDMGDQTSSPVENGRARYEACLAADGTLGACGDGPEPKASARDCGDGPFACRSGYVFGRADSGVHITADPTAAGNPNEAWATFEATVPGTISPSGTTYGTVGSGFVSQSSVYVIRTTNGGASWSAPARIDAQPVGNQLYADIDADSGALHAVWQDSRSSTGTGPDGSWKSVPFQNQWVATNPPGAVSSGPGLETFYATSSDGGATWSSQAASAAPYPLQWEQFGNRDVPFFGDYNYIDAVGSSVFLVWTDGRDTVPGIDPRYTNGDGTDGFDVHQCRIFSGGAWSADICPNAGGLDQNIYGRALP